MYDEIMVFANETLSESDLDALMSVGPKQFLSVSASGKLTTTWANLKAEIKK